MGIEVQVWGEDGREFGVATLLAMPPAKPKDVLSSVPFPLAVAIARQIAAGRREGKVGRYRWLRTA